MLKGPCAHLLYASAPSNTYILTIARPKESLHEHMDRYNYITPNTYRAFEELEALDPKS